MLLNLIRRLPSSYQLMFLLKLNDGEDYEKHRNLELTVSSAGFEYFRKLTTHVEVDARVPCDH